MQYKYAQKVEAPHAKAVGPDLSISTKHSIEICRWIRGKKVQKAKDMLNMAMEKKVAVPFKRFKGDIGHKPGMMAGRYPVKACKEILTIIESAEANAQAKGLSTEDCILHILCHKAAKVRRYGRNIGRFAKRTTIEAVLEEKKKAEKKTPAKKEASKDKQEAEPAKKETAQKPKEVKK